MGRQLHLTEKQKRYCRNRSEGKAMSQAYWDAGYTASKKNAFDSAYRLEHELKISPEIQMEIARLKAEAEAGAVLDRQARQALLTGIALDRMEKTDNRLRATDMLNRMSGDYTDNVRTSVSGGVELTYEERKRLIEEELSE